MKSKLLLIFELVFLLAGLVAYALGYLPLPILPLFVVAWVSLRLRGLRWRDVGLKRPKRWLSTIGYAILFGIGYQVLDVLFITPLLEKMTGQPVDLSQFALIRGNLPFFLGSLLASWTLAAFIEELFFRGYLLNRTMDFSGRDKKGILIALVLNALVFGVAHFYQGTTGVIGTTLAGLVLGGLYFFAGNNLWLPILTHGIIDTTGFLLIYLGWQG